MKPQVEPRTPSRELRAVLKIVNVDEEVKRKALHHVDQLRESINWDGIFSNDLSSGQRSALIFAKAIWCDQVTTQEDPFDLAFAMSSKLRMACIEALAIRWGLIN